MARIKVSANCRNPRKHSLARDMSPVILFSLYCKKGNTIGHLAMDKHLLVFRAKTARPRHSSWPGGSLTSFARKWRLKGNCTWQIARDRIDQMLLDAGWSVQDKTRSTLANPVALRRVNIQRTAVRRIMCFSCAADPGRMDTAIPNPARPPAEYALPGN